MAAALGAIEMTMNGLQHLVCRAAIDTDFLRLIARSPADALRGFDVADDEASMIEALRPQSLEELARGVEAWRRGDFAVGRSTVSGTALVALVG